MSFFLCVLIFLLIPTCRNIHLFDFILCLCELRDYSWFFGFILFLTCLLLQLSLNMELTGSNCLTFKLLFLPPLYVTHHPLSCVRPPFHSYPPLLFSLQTLILQLPVLIAFRSVSSRTISDYFCASPMTLY